MPKICGLILLILWGTTTLAWAEDEFLSETYRQCMEQAETTSDMNLCLVEEIKHQDERLNTAYEKLMENLPGSKQQKLWEAQLIWIEFRNAYMDFLYEYEEGRASNIVSSFWYVYATAEQARQLEYLLSVYE